MDVEGTEAVLLDALPLAVDVLPTGTHRRCFSLAAYRDTLKFKFAWNSRLGTGATAASH